MNKKSLMFFIISFVCNLSADGVEDHHGLFQQEIGKRTKQAVDHINKEWRKVSVKSPPYFVGSTVKRELLPQKEMVIDLHESCEVLQERIINLSVYLHILNSGIPDAEKEYARIEMSYGNSDESLHKYLKQLVDQFYLKCSAQ